MGLNFKGLGFSFGTKGSDQTQNAFAAVGTSAERTAAQFGGAEDAAASLSNAFGHVLGSSLAASVGLFKDIGAQASQAGALISGAMSIATLGVGGLLGALQFVVNLGPSIAGAVGGAFKGVSDQIHDLSTAGLNLTSQLESEALSHATTVRAIGVNYGYLGKELDKFIQKSTRMAMELNIGVNETAAAQRGWDEAGDAIKAFGFKSVKEFAKFTSALGINADSIRNNALVMQDLIGLTGKDGTAVINRITGSLQDMGRQTGDVTGAFELLDDVVGTMSRVKALNKNITKAELGTLVSSITATAAGLFKAGIQDSKQALALATDINEKILSSKENLANMFAGTANELDDFAKELAISGGNIDFAFEMMKKGPEGVLEGMAGIVEESKRVGRWDANTRNFLRGRMGAMGFAGKELSNLMLVIEQFGAEEKAAMQQNRLAVGSLGDLGNQAQRTGRTLEEQLGILKESANDAFRVLGKPAVRDWFANVSKDLREFKGTMRGMAKDDGPLGLFVTKLSEASQIGMYAFMPQSMHGIVTVMGNLADKLGPTVEMLGKFGLNLTSISGIALSAATGLALWAGAAWKAKKPTESFSQSMVRMGTTWIKESSKMIKGVATWFGELAKMFAEFDWAGLFSGESTTGGAKDGVGQLLDVVKNEFKDIEWGKIADDVAKGFGNLWDALATEENKARFDKAISFMGEKINAAFEFITPGLLKIIGSIDWGDIGYKIAAAIAKAPVTALGKLGEYIGNTWYDNDTREGKGSSKEELAALLERESVVEKHVKKIQGTMDGFMLLPVAKFQVQAEEVKGHMDGIMLHAEKITDNSIHTYFGNDMQKTVDITEAMSQKMIASLDNVSLSGQDVFAKMWYGIEKDTRSAVDKISEIAERLVSNLEQIATMRSQIVDADSALASRLATPSVNEDRDRRIKALTGDKAVHEPLWYAGAGGYRDLFEARMDRLISAIEGMRFQQQQQPAVQTSAGPSRVPTRPRPKNGNVNMPSPNNGTKGG